MGPAHSQRSTNTPFNDSVAPSNRTDYREPAESATVETVLLKLSGNQIDSCRLSAEEQAAAGYLVKALSAMRQYNDLLNRDGRLSGLHGCLFVVGQSLYDSDGSPRALPADFGPLQRALITAHKAASSGDLNPAPVKLEPVIDAAHRLFEKIFGIDQSLPWGN